MYTATAAAKALEAARSRPSRGQGRVPAMIYWLGATSLLVDISSEMLTSVLPVFLLTVLSLSPLQVGLLDGIFQGVAALTQVYAAHRADATKNNRRVASIGYAMSVAARGLLWISLFTGVLFAFAALLSDRVGKGMRTAPRDALIAAHAGAGHMNAAFGVHRTMDATGAFVGPLVATGILWLWTDRYDILLGTSLVFAMLGTAVFLARVRNPAPNDAPPSAEHAASGATPASTTLPQGLRLLSSSRPYRRLLLVVCGLGLCTVSDGMLFLVLQQQAQLPARYLPILYVCSALLFLIAALPLARAADRWGAKPVFLFGYVCLAAACAMLFLGTSAPRASVALTVLLTGLHHAATDGVLPVIVVRLLAPSIRVTGLALIATVSGLARLASSPILGWLWLQAGTEPAMLFFALGLALCIVLAVWAMPSTHAKK